MTRPREPAYASKQKILRAIRECSCGKFTRWLQAEAGALVRSDDDFVALWFLERNMDTEYREMRYECDCVGRKSPSELYAITKLHRNTVHRTLNYFIARRILRRRVEKRLGHHVTYAIARRRNLDIEIDHLVSRPEERQDLARTLKAIITVSSTGSEIYENFCRKHQRSISLLNDRLGPNRKRLNRVTFMALTRFVERYGYPEGLHKLVDAHKRLEEREHDAFDRIVAAKGTIPTLDWVRRYADYLEKQDTISMTSKR